MEVQQKIKIKEAAKRVTDCSEQFQLIHATYACRQLIIENLKKIHYRKCKELKEKIFTQFNQSASITDQLKKEKEILHNEIANSKINIDVEYINVPDENVARVIKIENAFVICLAKSLLESIFDSDGNYNYETIKKIRNLMAHELGHLVLHTEELMSYDTQGSLKIKSEEKEEEANYFKDELLELRRQRNEKMYKDGGAHNLLK